jgi:hypothetical protein
MEESVINVEGLYKEPNLNADAKKGIYVIPLFFLYAVLYILLIGL